MSRKDEINASIKCINELIELYTKEDVTQEQITNYNLAIITHLLADINVTLAIIADKLGGTNES